MEDNNDLLNKMYLGDCRDVLSSLPDNFIDLVVTSPPYNVGVDYNNYDDSIPFSQYQSMLLQTLELLDSKVDDSGRVCINVGLKNDGSVVDLPRYVKKAAFGLGWDLRFEIVWNKGSSESSSAWGSWRSPSSPRPIFNHEYILVFDVGDGGKEYEKSIPKERFMEIVKSVWTINPETSKIQHPSPFPKELPRRLIELNSYEGDVVLDPFIGTGTTALVADKMDRRWIGIDVDEGYIELARDRMANS